LILDEVEGPAEREWVNPAFNFLFILAIY
jgi:hypothetical protein